jgi:hypothetical protein
VLVESVRTATGPRQKYIGYLGSIPSDAENDADAVVEFWVSAESNLRAAGVSGADLARVVAALERVVPRPADLPTKEDRKDRKDQKDRWRDAVSILDRGERGAFKEWERRHGSLYAPGVARRIAAFLAERARQDD